MAQFCHVLENAGIFSINFGDTVPTQANKFDIVADKLAPAAPVKKRKLTGTFAGFETNVDVSGEVQARVRRLMPAGASTLVNAELCLLLRCTKYLRNVMFHL